MSVRISNPTKFIHASQTIEIQSQPKIGNQFANQFRNTRLESYSGDTTFQARKKQKRIFNVSFERMTDEDYSQLQDFFQNTLSGQIERFDLLCVPLSAEPYQTGLTINGVPVTLSTLIHGAPIASNRPYMVWDRYQYQDVYIEPNSFQYYSSNRGNLHNVSMTLVIEQ